MKKNNQKGLALLSGLLILAVVVAATTTGWYVWRQSNDQKNISSFEECIKAGNPVQESYPEVCRDKKGKSFTNTNQNKYLEIREWGVKLKDENIGAYYVPPQAGYQWLYLSSNSLDAFAKNHEDCKDVNRSVTLNRSKPGDDNFGSPWTEQELMDIGKKVGAYYYRTEVGQSCSPTASMEEIDEASKLRHSLPSPADIESI